MLKQLAIYSLLASCASAKVMPGYVNPNYQTNLTVSFYPDSDETSCKANDTTSSILFTTATIPHEGFCYNISTLFTQPSSFGFRNGSSRPGLFPPPMRRRDRDQPDSGMYWRLENQANYDSAANYSHIWFRQHNLSGEAGGPAPWLFSVFPEEDCHAREEEEPFYVTTCATEDGGTCRTVPYGVKSFRVFTGALVNEDKCAEWRVNGDPRKDESRARRVGGAMGAVLGIVSFAVVFLVL